MRWRRRWEEDWFDWEEDGPKLIKRIVLGVISAALAVAGCFVFVSSNVGMFGGGIHEGFVSDSFEESLENSSEEIVEEDSDIVYARDFMFAKIQTRDAYTVVGLSKEGQAKTDIVIPSMYNGLPVEEIKEEAFTRCAWLQSVVIGDNVTSIGGSAFSFCSSLTYVELSNSVTTIEDAAFYYCENITNIFMPDSVVSIGDLAFFTCRNLPNLILGENLTRIGYSAFEGCTNLTFVRIPDSVTRMERDAFYGCSNLSRITVDENNTEYQSIDGNLYNKNGTTLIQYAIGKTATEFAIPEGVTEIGSYAFAYCDSLTSVIIPDSVTSIGYGAFGVCDGLTTLYYQGAPLVWENLDIGGNNEALTQAKRYYYSETAPTEEGNWWYYNAQGNVKVWDEEEIDLIHARDFTFERISGREAYRVTGLSAEGKTKSDVVIPNVYEGLPVVEIKGGSNAGEGAFNSCRNLMSVVIGDNVTTIGNWAFEDCSSLTNVVIPDSVMSIGSLAFYYCSSLTSVVIGDGVTTIGYGAFLNCSSLTSVVIGDSVTTIGSYAFTYCNSLTSMVIGDSVTTIGECAFADCSSLTSVVIGDSVTTIGERAFSSCSSLTSVYYKGTASDWENISIDSSNYELTAATKYYYSETEPALNNDGTAYDGNYWHYNASGKIVEWKYVMPSQGLAYTLNEDGESYSVTGIGECTDTDVVIPATYTGAPVTTIGHKAFYDCRSLMSVVIPDSVTSIGSYAFYNCSSLTSVEIPDSVTSIGYEAFYNCSRLTSVVIPDSVTSIGSYAFNGCSSLTYNEYGNCKYLGNENNPYHALIKVTGTGYSNYTIHEDTKTITGEAFSGCYSLTSVVIPDSVTSIGNSAFYNCGSLTSVVIPDSVTSIGSSAFYNCDSLTSVTIGDSVTSIGVEAFYDCRNLTSVVIPDSVTSIGYRAFRYCSKLAEIKVSGNNTAYQSIDSNLYSKDGKTLIQYAIGKTATEFVIPEGVTTIGVYAFSSCDGLTSVVIGDSVTAIGYSAFSDCYSLTTVYYKGAASDWENISIDYYNDYLTSATRYYYSESEDVAMWWHYDENGNIVHA